MERIKRSNSQKALRPFRGEKEYSTIVNLIVIILFWKVFLLNLIEVSLLKKTLLPVDESDAGGNKIKYSFSRDHFAKPEVLTIACIVHLQARVGQAAMPRLNTDAFFPGAVLGAFVPQAALWAALLTAHKGS